MTEPEPERCTCHEDGRWSPSCSVHARARTVARAGLAAARALLNERRAQAEQLGYRNGGQLP